MTTEQVGGRGRGGDSTARACAALVTISSPDLLNFIFPAQLNSLNFLGRWASSRRCWTRRTQTCSSGSRGRWARHSTGLSWGGRPACGAVPVVGDTGGQAQARRLHCTAGLPRAAACPPPHRSRGRPPPHDAPPPPPPRPPAGGGAGAPGRQCRVCRAAAARAGDDGPAPQRAAGLQRDAQGVGARLERQRRRPFGGPGRRRRRQRRHQHQLRRGAPAGCTHGGPSIHFILISRA